MVRAQLDGDRASQTLMRGLDLTPPVGLTRRQAT